MKKIIFMVLILIIAIYGCAEQKINTETKSASEENLIFNTVNIEDFSFKPASLAVPKNTKISWIQKDSVKHTVTSDNGIFDSGLLSKSEVWSYVFKEAGTYEYHCTVHPSMTGKIIVK